LQPTCYPRDRSTVNEDEKLLDGSTRFGEARTRLNSAIGGDSAMNERKWPFLSLAGSLALAGLAVVFAQSLPYAAILIGVAVALVIGTVVWSAWESIPRILTNPEQAKEAARSIYRHAAKPKSSAFPELSTRRVVARAARGRRRVVIGPSHPARVLPMGFSGA